MDINYQTYKTLDLNGEANQNEELILGDAYFPNNAPKLALALNYETLARVGLANNGLPLDSSSAEANKLKDDSGQIDLTVGGIFSLAENMHGLGNSLMFDETYS